MSDTNFRREFVKRAGVIGAAGIIGGTSATGSVAADGSGTIRGGIFHVGTNTTLDGVTMSLEGPSTYELSDIDGSYSTSVALLNARRRQY